MVRSGETERETLRQAAEAATGLLPKLRQDRLNLDARIASLDAIITAWEALSGKRPKKPTLEFPQVSDVDVSTPRDTTTGKHKRGQAAEHVDAILGSGGDYEEPDLRKAIAQQFSVVYGRSTVYTILRRGREAGKYEQEKKRWRMKVA